MGGIITIDFRGDRLLGIETEAGALIPLRPLVLGMGLDWSSQRKRIKRDAILAGAVVMMTTGSDPEAMCLPLDLVPGFLFRIDASRVDEAVRGKVLDYQRHCFGVLAQALVRPRQDAPALVAEPTDVVPLDIARRLVTEARHTFDRQASRELWFKLRLPTVPAMQSAPRQGGLFTYTAERRP